MQNRTLISAGEMAMAVQNDPQLSMPGKPRLLKGLVVIPMGDGLMVEGAGERQVFRGRNSTRFLPRLLELLDGTRTLEEICRTFPQLSPNHVVQATALLYTRGLLEDLDETTPMDDGPWDEDLFKFLARHVDVTRVNRNIYEGMTRLKNTSIVIIGPESLTTVLADEVKKSGINTSIKTWSAAEAAAADLEGLREDPPDLIVGLGLGDEAQAFYRAVNYLARNKNVPWLRVHLSKNYTSVGPMFRVPETPCFECFTALNGEDETSEPGKAASLLGVSIAASEIINTTSRLMPPITRQDTLHFDHGDWTQRRERFPRRPGCEECSPIEGISPQMNLAAAYEQAVAFPPKHLMSPKDHQVHYLRRNMDLQYDNKTYLNAPRTPLPAENEEERGMGTFFDLLPGATERESPGETQLDQQTLSSLLLKTFGLRPGETDTRKVQRWAPTGGNLGSAQGYVLARGIPDLPFGLYFYHASEHELARMAVDAGELEEMSAYVEADGPGSPWAAIIFTGALQRVAAKYGPFAYRVIQLDAGVAAAQLYALSRSFSLGFKMAHRWPDAALEEIMQLNPEIEPITRVITISEGGESP